MRLLRINDQELADEVYQVGRCHRACVTHCFWHTMGRKLIAHDSATKAMLNGSLTNRVERPGGNL